jgi:hypothetical protein
LLPLQTILLETAGMVALRMGSSISTETTKESMPNESKLKELSRQQLYDLIWSKSIADVAAEYDVTEATVKNHCNNRKVPRPRQRYWKKLAAGYKPHKKPLPAVADEIFEAEAQKRVPKLLALPESGAPLHAQANQLLMALNKIKPREKKLVHLEDPNFPEVTVSKPLVERAAQAFHVLLKTLEPLGIEFKSFKGTMDTGYFKHGRDRLFFRLYETLVDHSGVDRLIRYYHWDAAGTPSGRMAFYSRPYRYYNTGEKEWQETKGHRLELVLSEVVCDIREYFLTNQRNRIQWAIDRKIQQAESERRHREWLVEEEIREKKEAEKAHAAAIQSVVKMRKQDLIKASEWWHRSCRINEYIEDCERRWKSVAGELTPEQSTWLSWAREIVNNMSPFTVGYPEPSKHGAFDPATVPFGGPYPTAQNLPATT